MHIKYYYDWENIQILEFLTFILNIVNTSTIILIIESNINFKKFPVK